MDDKYNAIVEVAKGIDILDIPLPISLISRGSLEN